MMRCMKSDALRATAGLTAALLVIVLAWATAPASAASYTVWSCRGPVGVPVSTQAWAPGDGSDATHDSCAQGGSLRARLTAGDDSPWTARGYRFLLPAGAVITGYRIHLHASTAQSHWGHAYQAGIDDDVGLSAGAVDAGCLTSGCVYGVADEPLADVNLVARAGVERHALVLAVRCSGLFGCFGRDAAKTLADARIFRSQVDLRDDSAPLLGAASGALVGGQSLTGTADVSFGASDIGGGVAALSLLIDGIQSARHAPGGSCAQPFTVAAPCPDQLGMTFLVDASKLAAGPHTARLQAVDAAGNTTTGPPIAFTAAAASLPPAPPPAPPPAVIERRVEVPVAMAPRAVRIEPERSRVELPGGGAAITGIVRSAEGSPADGVRVTVRSRPFGVRHYKLRAERFVTTDAAGRFSVPAGTTSRLVVLDVDDATHRAEEPAEVELLQRLRVAAQVRDRDLRNGSSMTLRASIDGAGGGVAGRTVLIQAIVGGRWSTVQSLMADASGDAVWRYRFRGTTRRASYRFRVRVENAGDAWPWPTTTSAVVRVEVAP